MVSKNAINNFSGPKNLNGMDICNYYSFSEDFSEKSVIWQHSQGNSDNPVRLSVSKMPPFD